MIRLAFILCLATPVCAETLVAARMVRPHDVITAQDLAIGEVGVPGALVGDADVVGLEARVTLYPGRPIMPEHVGPAALIERNQSITLVFRNGNLSISTEARALSRGAVGDLVRVMNVASKTTVVGRVRPDGRVEVHGD